MIAYLDLPSGLSGDMLLGCLLDAGWSVDRLRAVIESLSLSAAEWAIEVRPTVKRSLRATRVEVLVGEGVHQRRLADVVAIIEAGSLPPAVRERAVAVFRRLAAAEAKVHGTTPDQIHFHEVGAVDAIIDIVACVSGLHELGVTQLYASAIPLGPGWTDSAHGRLPLPAPATLELLAQAKAPTRAAPGPGELLTPTGAALLAELARFEQPLMRLDRIGVGAGQRDFPWPNVARLWLGEALAPPATAEPVVAAPPTALVQLETNIDDMNPQLYSAVSERLFERGARDVWLTPVQMKKGRPGVVLSVLAEAADEDLLADVLLRETTTLGVRVHAIARRHEAGRTWRTVATAFGSVRVKVKWMGEDAVDATPEYEDCRALAEQTRTPLLQVQQAAVAAGQAMLHSLRETAGRSSTPDDLCDPRVR